jgi:sulfur-oxidizing protein SoxY
MGKIEPTLGLMRRVVLQAAIIGVPGLIAAAASAEDDADLVKRLIGKTPQPSSRVHLTMPSTFPDGYTVPLTLDVDSPMTEADHVRVVHIIAPRNPIIVTAAFFFTPQSGRAYLSTRIRLAEPQNVLAIAEMSDGAVLMAKTWVKVATNGCA